jgi:hypothetical protein
MQHSLPFYDETIVKINPNMSGLVNVRPESNFIAGVALANHFHTGESTPSVAMAASAVPCFAP